MQPTLEGFLPLGTSPSYFLGLSSGSSTPDPILITLVIVLIALVVAIVVLLTQRGREKPRKAKSSKPQTSPKPQQRSDSDRIVPERPDPPTTRPSVRKKHRRVLPTREEAMLAEDAGDYKRAASVWMARGNRIAQLRALRLAGDEVGLAKLEMAMGWPKLAIPRLENLSARDPNNIDHQLMLFDAYLDVGDHRKAKELSTQALQRKKAGVAAGHLARFARGFEASGDTLTALKFYEEAAKGHESAEDFEVRILYLSEMNRLQDPPETTSDDNTAKEMLALVIGEEPPRPKPTSPGDMLELELMEASGEAVPPRSSWSSSNSRTQIPILPGHEVIVGHLALGGDGDLANQPARSIASLASRLELKRLVGEGRSTVVFEGVDRLLDCPVAVKLCHVALAPPEFDILRDRLKAIASLNHPNLTKATFVDRQGNVVRVVTEFHSGGNLENMLTRMEKVGLPLMLRLMMQVASGVHSAHSHGVIHGDLRPRNIMIGHDQLIKVVDFALGPHKVRRLKPDDSRGRDVLQLFPSEEIQSDLTRFADLLDYVLERTVVSSMLAGNFEAGDPIDELREVARRTREGAFSSLSPIQRIFQQILEGIQPMGRTD